MNATVKRKFNALLNGIGNRPSSVSAQEQQQQQQQHASSDNPLDPAASPASSLKSSSSPASSRMASDLEFLSKKRRVGATPTKYGTLTLQPHDSSSPVGSSKRGVTTISNVSLRKWTPTGANAATAEGRDGGPPKYCPGDREQLVRRLATFQELTDWTPKPDRVNEVEWAKRGWVCRGKECVKCTLCSKELVVKLNRREVDGREISVLIASEIAESVVDKYAELIIDAHAEDCLWKKKGCDGENPHSLPNVPLYPVNQSIQLTN
jgi:hypothetical protein